MKIGILAIQGDFLSHKKKLEQLGVESILVKKPDELKGLDGLIIPGGESTTMSRIIQDMGLLEPLMELKDKKIPVFGTCAGLILMAKEIVDGEKVLSLGMLDIKVQRNAYGRQRESFEAKVMLQNGKEIHGVFIRAPRIIEVKNSVKVLGSIGKDPVLVQQESFLEATLIHRMFVEMVGQKLK